jgi:PAS domain-containing protein
MKGSLTKNQSHGDMALDNELIGVITLDKNGIIKSMNKASEVIFCCKPVDVVGKSISTLLPSYDGSSFIKHFNPGKEDNGLFWY